MKVSGQKRKVKAKTSSDVVVDDIHNADAQKTGDPQSSDVCVFVKKRKVAASMRNRAKNPMFQTTVSEKKEAEPVLLTAAANTTAVTTGSEDQLATALNSIETDRDRDATAIKKRAKVLQKEAREKGDNVYRGQAGYLDYLGKEDTSGQIKGAGIKAGPIRGSLYARAITRIDFAPDICKDYKETGYCGYGDSCKFMHDRGDYKRGWELDKEWDEQQQAKARREQDGESKEKKDEEDDSFPFACFVCRGLFTDPVKTKCGHFFCERCAVKECKLNCNICGKPTNGAFSVASKLERQKLEESAKRAAEAAAAAAAAGSDDDEEEDD